MLRFTSLLLASTLALLAVPGCAVDDETNETSGGDGGGGDGVSLDATPSEDSSIDTGSAPDTSVEEDTAIADTAKPDTGADTGFFVDTGFGFDTAIDTMVPDTFVPPACTTPADCPFADLECAKKTCEGGKCGVFFVPKGTPTGPQTDGDCKRRECDGAGLAVIAYDPKDPPKDTNQCINEYCKGAVPTFDPFPPRHPCATSTGSMCDGAGKCVQCVAPSDCPGSDTVCSFRTCVMGVCGTGYIADGTAIAAQTAGDCRKVVCNGAGATKTVYDSTDPQSDGRVCTTDVCRNDDGIYTSHQPLPSGTTCDGTFKCGDEWGEYDDGVCGECDVDDDCRYRLEIPSNDSCVKPKCTAHTCAAVYEPEGTACTGYAGCTDTCLRPWETATYTYCPCGAR